MVDLAYVSTHPNSSVFHRLCNLINIPSGQWSGPLRPVTIIVAGGGKLSLQALPDP